MKTLYLIGGPMGVGKTTVSQILKNRLPNAVYLDGDWCWDASPFQVTEETKTMVIDNICHILSNFLRCSAYENIVFSWVMHQQSIIDTILERLPLSDCKLLNISLICDERNLRKRLEKDISTGIRTKDVIERSLARLPLYSELDTEKVDTSNKSAERVADRIIWMMQEHSIIFDPAVFVIENGVLLKYLGDGGDIIIPDGVKEIDDRAFEDIPQDALIRSIIIPDSVEVIPAFTFSSFSDQNVGKVRIGTGIREIGEAAFLQLWNVTEWEATDMKLKYFMKSGFGGFCFYPFHTVFRSPQAFCEGDLERCIYDFPYYSEEDLNFYLKDVTIGEILFLEEHDLIPEEEMDMWLGILRRYGEIECMSEIIRYFSKKNEKADFSEKWRLDFD